jgi:hypothetical protein
VAKKLYKKYNSLCSSEKSEHNICSENYINEYENSKARKITSPKSGRKILRRGTTAKKLYEEYVEDKESEKEFYKMYKEVPVNNGRMFMLKNEIGMEVFDRNTIDRIMRNSF